MVVSPSYTLPLPQGYAPSTTTSNPLSLATPVLTSGGLDLNLIVVCCSSAASILSSTKLLSSSPPNPISESTSTEFESTTHRRASYVPQRSKPFMTGGGKENRYLVLRRERSIGLWKLEDPRLGSGTGAGINSGERDSGWGGKKMNFDAMHADGEEEEKEEVGGWKKVLDMDLKVSSFKLSFLYCGMTDN